MKIEPHVSKYIDEEEKELIEAIESDDYELGKSELTPEKLQMFQDAARNTIREVSTKISIRIPNSTLARVKAQALEEGIPYQTFIGSILHKSINS